MQSGGDVIVEFVGLPAVGKTRLANEVRDRLSAADTGPKDVQHRITTSSNRRNSLGTISIGKLALRRFLRSPITSLKTIAPLNESGQPNLRYKLRYFAYLLYVVEEIHRARGAGDTYLGDQGFLQHLWRIHLTGDHDSMDSLHELAMDYYPIVDPDIVVFVSVDHRIRMERAVGRGNEVDPDLFDPNHPLIKEDREAYEAVRAFVPMVATEHGSNVRIVDIENTQQRLDENVDRITDAIRDVRKQKATQKGDFSLDWQRTARN